MVRFEVREVKAEYDYESRTSAYKAEMWLGNAEAKIQYDLPSDTARFEIEGNNWEVGYAHQGRTLHGKKKWRVTKNALFIMRQDVPNMNFAVLPSPELQLEHEVHRFAGMDKHKLELKYHTFWKKTTIEEEAHFGGRWKFKSALDNVMKVNSSKLSLEGEFGHRLLDEVKIEGGPSRPLVLSHKMKPLPFLKLKTSLLPTTRELSSIVELQYGDENQKAELECFVSGSGWGKPRLQLSYTF